MSCLREERPQVGDESIGVGQVDYAVMRAEDMAEHLKRHRCRLRVVVLRHARAVSHIPKGLRVELVKPALLLLRECLPGFRVTQHGARRKAKAFRADPRGEGHRAIAKSAVHQRDYVVTVALDFSDIFRTPVNATDKHQGRVSTLVSTPPVGVPWKICAQIVVSRWWRRYVARRRQLPACDLAVDLCHFFFVVTTCHCVTPFAASFDNRAAISRSRPFAAC